MADNFWSGVIVGGRGADPRLLPAGHRPAGRRVRRRLIVRGGLAAKAGLFAGIIGAIIISILILLAARFSSGHSGLSPASGHRLLCCCGVRHQDPLPIGAPSLARSGANAGGNHGMRFPILSVASQYGSGIPEAGSHCRYLDDDNIGDDILIDMS